MWTRQTPMGWLAAAMMITSIHGCAGGESSGEPGMSPGFVEESVAGTPSALALVVPSAVLDVLIQDNTAFGIDLYRELSAGNSENVFISPASISTALAMTYAGARGRTQEQMARALHLTLPEGDVHSAFRALETLLDSRNIAPQRTPEGVKSLRLDLVNMVWAQKGLPILPDYTRTIATYYEGGLETLDFARDTEGARRTINSFVERKTEQKIKDLLPPGSLDPLSRLVLTNTVYFYGSWEASFEPQSTRPGVFHAPGGDVRVQMMHGEPYIGYAEGDGWQMIELPYHGRKLGMTILLPAAGRFAQIRDALTPAWLSEAVKQMVAHEEAVELSMPRFKFTYGTANLKEPLQRMGMEDAFDRARANFSGMTPEQRLNIGEVYHKTFLAVDEYGTEAAAATGVTMTFSGSPEFRVVEVNRPFIVLIRDTSGAALFIGQVMDPG